LGISADGVWCHASFARDRHLHFRCAPISNPRARWQGNTAPIVQARASTNVRCLSPTGRARLHGAIARRSRSIPAQMEFLTPSKGFQIRQELMAKLFIGGIRSGVNGTPTLASGMMCL
jgi:hypothetical protein